MFIFQLREKRAESVKSSAIQPQPKPHPPLKGIPKQESEPTVHMLENQLPNRRIEISVTSDCKIGPAKIGELQYVSKTNSLGLVFSQWPHGVGELPLQAAYSALHDYLKTLQGQEQYCAYLEQKLSFLCKSLGISGGYSLSQEARDAVSQRLGKIKFIREPSAKEIASSGQSNWTEGRFSNGYEVYSKFPMALEHEIGHAASDMTYLAQPFEQNPRASNFEEAFNSLVEGRDAFGIFSYEQFSDHLFRSLSLLASEQRKQVLDNCVGVWLNLPSAYVLQDDVYAFFAKALVAHGK